MGLRRWTAPFAAAGLVLAQGALALDGSDPLPKGRVRLSTAQGDRYVVVEVARSTAQREAGLMERQQLAPDEGMIFLYTAPRPVESGFWMYRTRIPLDIAFVDADGRILTLHTMPPCAETSPDRCPVYRPDAAYRSALEMNAGWFARHGVGRGDRVELLSESIPKK